MRTTTILAALLLAATAAHACKDDLQFQPDKQRHFAGSVAMAGVGAMATGKPWLSFGASVAVGAAVEWRDSTMTKTGHCASWQDFAYDVAGSAIGAYLGNEVRGFVISRNRVAFVVNENIF